MRTTGCSETSVTNCQSTLYNIPEERTSRVHRGGTLKSQMIDWMNEWTNTKKKAANKINKDKLYGEVNSVKKTQL